MRAAAVLAPAAVRYALKRTALVLLVLLLNPFGSVDGGDQLSHRVWQTIHADQYGKHARTRAVDAITVVTLDDVSMRAAAPADTAPDSVHLMQVFRTVAQANVAGQARPRAMFIDLFLGDFAPDEPARALLDFDRTAGRCPQALDADRNYDRAAVPSPFKCLLQGLARLTGYADQPGRPGWGGDVRCQQDQLAKLQCILRSGGVPILIASAVDPARQAAAAPSAGAEALAEVAIAVPVLVRDYGYALVSPEQAKARENRAYSLYPAAMLYTAWCARTGWACPANPVPPVPGAPRLGGARGQPWQWSGTFERPLDVTWGVGQPDAFTRLIQPPGSGTLAMQCRVAAPGFLPTARAFLKAWFAGLGFTRGTPCIYQHHLAYADVLRMLGGPSAQAFRRAALADKVVLVGMSTSESNDFVAAGPHAKLPGVYYHAMALDNLVEWGDDYPKVAWPILPPLTISNQDVWNAVAAFVMFLIGGFVHGRFRHAPIDPRHPWRQLARATGVLLVVIALMLVALFGLTGQVSLLPDQFNLAALSIVLVAEVIHIGATLIGPLLRPLLASVLRGAATQVESTDEPPHEGVPTS